jgi:hypothetical protein
MNEKLNNKLCFNGDTASAGAGWGWGTKDIALNIISHDQT